ncbi:aminotransferase class IV [Maribacter arenosus]|uniref:Aminotransferase class IV n=1 Tax=Maribacter arenosus TaxID=1854708 RepID=A0ABR7VBS1_9FLAO|nr:aminotransferase class IV [Maribacter arenosus]MBD0849509.1 aminotransferase class IV [Maribacter arenosus]
MAEYPKKVWLNGEILDAGSARISVFDRGFLFGDGIYEVMARIGGRFFYEKAHLKRLDTCLQKIKIDFDTRILTKEIPKLLQASDLFENDCLLYIQVSRGVAPRKHAFPHDIPPTVMMYVTPKILPDINSVNASVSIMNDFRWSRCDIKTTSLLGNVMANESAVQQGCYEMLFLRDDIVTEASHCNVFFVKDGTVYTHPANELILDGITRQVVLELCSQLNFEVREEGISKQRIPQMDEAFLTGTSTQIASIKQIDQHIYYTGDEIGEVTKALQHAFLALKNKE